MFKKILSFIIFLLVGFVGYLLVNTFTFQSKQPDYKLTEKISVSDSAVYRLSKAIQYRTVSAEDRLDFDSLQFKKFGAFLDTSYPLTKRTLKKEIINQYGYLYCWKGTDPSLKPVLLLGHYDVVPVPDEEVDKWTFPPFSGDIKDGIIWGRGTMDDKVSVIGILEAVEHLLSADFTPKRTIYLAFGFDEEIGGINGAGAIATLLQNRGAEPEFVLDEGLAITRGLVPGVFTDVALIGIAEKGFASLSLSVNIEGGHSSMPAAETAIDIIAGVITKLKANPFPQKITPPVEQFLEFVGPEMRFQQKLIFANKGLFESAILGVYGSSNSGRALIQTTMVPTIFKSGIKDNVIPSTAKAVINFRILPGTSVDDVLAYVTEIIADDRVQVALNDFHSEPSKISGINAPGFSVIDKSIKEAFPDVITAPNLVLGATDARYYGVVCKDIYRFLPIRLNPENISAVHGINEHIPTEEFKDVVRFYVRVIENCEV